MIQATAVKDRQMTKVVLWPPGLYLSNNHIQRGKLDLCTLHRHWKIKQLPREYRDGPYHTMLHTFKQQLNSATSSTYDEVTNRSNTHHCPELLWHLCDSSAAYKTSDSLTYLQCCIHLRLDWWVLCCGATDQNSSRWQVVQCCQTASDKHATRASLHSVNSDLLMAHLSDWGTKYKFSYFLPYLLTAQIQDGARSGTAVSTAS